MNLLLDTHLLLWALSNDKRLSKEARSMIMDEDNTIYFSSVSVWEVVLKHSLHPKNVTITGKDFSQYCLQAGFIPLEMTPFHAISVESLSYENSLQVHNDPFDRMLIGQAKSERYLFLTHDKLLAGYGEKCVRIV